MVIANSLMGNTTTGMKRGDTTLKQGSNKHGSMRESRLVEETVEEEDDEEPDEDGEPDIRNMTESEMESYYSMKALKKVYVKPAMPLRKAKNTSLQNYKIVKLLGQGGFGQVHLVKALKEDKQLMALKRILLCMGSGSATMTEQKRLRVMRETQIMETMKHPHIVTMHAHFIDSEVIESINEETGAKKSRINGTFAS